MAEHMDLRSRVKQALRIGGHAAIITVHERLDLLERQIDTLQEQGTSLARTQTAVLQACVHLVETVRMQQQGQVDGGLLQGLLEQVQRQVEADGGRLQSLLEQFQQHDQAEGGRSRSLLEQVQRQVEAEGGRLQSLLERGDVLAQGIANLHRYTQTVFEQELVRQVVVENDDYAFQNPEVGLMGFLYSHLPTRKVLDVGAHVGDVSARLLQAGFEVWAFEPYPATYEILAQRLGSEKSFHPFNMAVGRVEAELPLHVPQDLSPDQRYRDATLFNSLTPHSMPDDLPFTGTVLVPVTTLVKLTERGLLPADISMVKIDTEGYDLEVVKGMGGQPYPVVSLEFWDTRIPFGKSGLLYTFSGAVAEMRERGYQWFIVLYRVWGRYQTAFYCNRDRPVPESWGNIFFFQDYDTFAAAQEWCSAVLPSTYFKAAANK